MKTLYTLFILFILTATSFAQSAQYAKIKLTINTPYSIQELIERKIAIDHFHQSNANEIELELSYDELTRLDNLNVPYQILIADASAYYAELLNQNIGEIDADCGLSNFGQGSMGGYHTYDEVSQHLISMTTQFPELVHVFEAGKSVEERIIWGVKISDNVQSNESVTEGVVFYDALTHAREPLSMETLLYYMWWLLENYNTDPEATFLIDHREIYFIPVVNPDGYVFNQTTDPNGGGFWRKNRRDSGNGCYGVDLNRNYSYQWGLDSGSSNDPCSGTYRGEEPFSEPESVAVRDLVQSIQPAIAFSNHSYQNSFLSPFGYADTIAEYNTYAEFSSEFIPQDWIGYGTTSKMLGYTSSGTTRDYLHSVGVYTWTPEIGDFFWESPSVLCDRVTEYLKPMKYLSWVSGNYACFQDFWMENEQAWRGDTLAINVRIKNRGLTLSAENVQVTLESSDGLLIPLEDSQNYGDLPARSFQQNTSPFLFVVNEAVEVMDRLHLKVTVNQNGVTSYLDEFYITAGGKTILLQDNDDFSIWSTGGSNEGWELTAMDFTNGTIAFCDSDFDNYTPETDNYITLIDQVDLSGSEHPVIEFNAKWVLQPDEDNVQLQYSFSGGIWLPLEGDHTNSSGNYNRNQHWVQEQMDLSDFIDLPISIRFNLLANDFVQSDGFYFDDFKIVNYFEPIASDIEKIPDALFTFNVFPNPVKDRIYINIKTEKTIPATISIHDILGRTVFEKSSVFFYPSHQEEIDVSNLKTSVYFVKLETADEILVRKIIRKYRDVH